MLTPQLRLARTLYREWQQLEEPGRSRVAPIAREVKELALELRGRLDRGAAEHELGEANEALAILIVKAVAGTRDEAAIRMHIEREFTRATLDSAQAA